MTQQRAPNKEPESDRQNIIPVGISSCLMGEKVRYDGGHRMNPYIVETLSQYFDFRPFCPEMAIGMGTPRPPVHLVKEGDTIEALGVESNELRVTKELRSMAQQQKPWQAEIYGYIVKKGSPSCGVERVKIYSNGYPRDQGSGLYTQILMENFPDMPVEDEDGLVDPQLCKDFIQRVFSYYRQQKGYQAWSITV